MAIEYITNPRLELSFDYLLKTNCNVFLTGKAGTGKTQFLKKLREISPKSIVVTAPTGVAAINANGVTMHSFFQLPFGVFIKGSSEKEFNRFSREKIKALQSFDVLVIDEVSMVRADMLDAVDYVLRRFRHNPKPCGGVQLLLIGDLQQLSPVVTSQEESIIRQLYQTPYFFSSIALQQTNLVGIELNHIFRQKDEVFVDILNQIRDNNISDESLEILNRRHFPDFKPKENENIITLVTHNRQADQINESKLAQIKEEEHEYQATIKGEFPEKLYPMDKTLVLKKGAVVMFLKNDVQGKKFYNGKIARVSDFDEDAVYVKCDDQQDEIRVVADIWENTKYEGDSTAELKQVVIGTFCQIPLRLAWAVTIHKSQGLTFSKMMLDTQKSFAHGQVYVALSRCRSLDGLYLLSKIIKSDIITDNTVSDYIKNVQDNIPDKQKFEIDNKNCILDCVVDLMDFNYLFTCSNAVLKMWNVSSGTIGTIGSEFETLPSLITNLLISVADKFNIVVLSQFRNNSTPIDQALMARIYNGLNYCLDKLETIAERQGTHIYDFDCNNDDEKESIASALYEFRKEYSFKHELLKACKDNFSLNNYLLIRKKLIAKADEGVLSATSKVATNLGKNPKLYKMISDFRSDFSKEHNIVSTNILSTKNMLHIADTCPKTAKELANCPGLKTTKAYLIKYIFDLIVEYLKENKNYIVPKEEIENAKYESLSTQGKSQFLFDMHQNAVTVAKIRGVKLDTILGHLAPKVEQGLIEWSKIISKEDYNKVLEARKENPKADENAIYKLLEYKVSSGVIKIVFASMKSQREFD